MATGYKTTYITLPELTVMGSLCGPSDTVNADIVQAYSVNGLNPLTIPIVLVKVS